MYAWADAESLRKLWWGKPAVTYLKSSSCSQQERPKTLMFVSCNRHVSANLAKYVLCVRDDRCACLQEGWGRGGGGREPEFSDGTRLRTKSDASVPYLLKDLR